MRFAVIGGGGYIGFHISVQLVSDGHSVVGFDINEPHPEWVRDAEELLEFRKEHFRLVKGDILSLPDLMKAVMGADCVIHCVSYGMSGREQMPSRWDKTELINIQGTRNVILAASTAGVSGLVYTSTCNVVFGGQEIRNGDETLPYFPLHRHIDHYSRTKSVAEQLVLIADGKQSPKNEHRGKALRTCSLRLAGVIGVKEKRHLPRIMSLWPMFQFRFGYGESLAQFVGIQNVVQAHVKAATALLEKPNVLGGEAYFISDGVPINSFEYFRPVIEGMGHTVVKKNNIPMFLVWFGAYLTVFLHWLLHRVWDFQPLLAPAEIYKTASTHYFSNNKARRDFGYEPKNPNDLSEVCNYYSQNQK